MPVTHLAWYICHVARHRGWGASHQGRGIHDARFDGRRHRGLAHHRGENLISVSVSGGMASGPFANHLGASDRQLARCAIVRARFNIGSRPRRLGLLPPRVRKSPLLVQREERSATSLRVGITPSPGRLGGLCWLNSVRLATTNYVESLGRSAWPQIVAPCSVSAW